MLKALGYPVLAVGLVMGLQTFIPTAPAPFVPAAVDEDIAFLPPKPSVTAQRAETPIVAPRPVPVIRWRTASTASPAANATASITVKPWRTAVVSFDAADSKSTATTATAATVADRYQLARSIQQELKRVGCYLGEIDGSWGLGSKRAVAAFMQRVNASLPITEPDYILLALIRAQPAAACSAPCPQGQAYAADGRCVPNAILAQSTRRNGLPVPRAAASAAEAHVAWTVEVRPSAGAASNLPPPAPLFGRMSVGGPTAVASRPNAADTPADGATYTTASLTDDGNAAAALEPGAVLPEVIPPPARSAKPKKATRSEGRTRSVHQLFMHPLGRM